MVRENKGHVSAHWQGPSADWEAEVLANTFKNSQFFLIRGGHRHSVGGTNRINWIDQDNGTLDRLHPKSRNPVEGQFAVIKSCIKGGNKQETKTPLQAFCRREGGRRSLVLDKEIQQLIQVKGLPTLKSRNRKRQPIVSGTPNNQKAGKHNRLKSGRKALSLKLL